jgi:hypothetical protein
MIENELGRQVLETRANFTVFVVNNPQGLVWGRGGFNGFVVSNNPIGLGVWGGEGGFTVFIVSTTPY